MQIVPGRRGRPDKVFFRTEADKQREIEKGEIEIQAIEELKATVGEECSPESLLALLKYAGSSLDSREHEGIGLLRGGRVMSVVNDNVIWGDYGDSGFFYLWSSDARELTEGRMVKPVTVFVFKPTMKIVKDQVEFKSKSGEFSAYTESYSITNAILVAVEEDELRAAIGGLPDMKPANSKGAEMRKWTSGKNEVMAEAISWSDKTVKLKRKDGKTITVKRRLLSSKDNDYLDSLE